MTAATHGYGRSRSHPSPPEQTARHRHAVRCVCRRVFDSVSLPGMIPRLVAFLVMMRALAEHARAPDLDDRALERERERRAQRRRAGRLAL